MLVRPSQREVIWMCKTNKPAEALAKGCSGILGGAITTITSEYKKVLITASDLGGDIDEHHLPLVSPHPLVYPTSRVA